MQTIRSGTTNERVVRTALITLLLVGYAGWSLWDGYIEYPRRNVTAALTGKIGSAMPDPVPMPDPQITGDTAGSISTGVEIGDIHQRLGDPHLIGDDTSIYFGFGGYLSIVHTGGRVREVQWNRGPTYSATDLSAQRLIGWSLTPIALAFIFHLVRVFGTRVLLSEDGLKVGGHPTIALNTITGITSVSARASRRYAVHYGDESRSGVVYLDDYVVKDATAMVSAICEQCDLPDPTKADAGSP